MDDLKLFGADIGMEGNRRENRGIDLPTGTP